MTKLTFFIKNIIFIKTEFEAEPNEIFLYNRGLLPFSINHFQNYFIQSDVQF